MATKPMSVPKSSDPCAHLRPARGVAPLTQPSGKTTVARPTPATGRNDKRGGK